MIGKLQGRLWSYFVVSQVLVTFSTAPRGSCEYVNLVKHILQFHFHFDVYISFYDCLTRHEEALERVRKSRREHLLYYVDFTAHAQVHYLFKTIHWDGRAHSTPMCWTINTVRNLKPILQLLWQPHRMEQRNILFFWCFHFTDMGRMRTVSLC